MYILISLFFIVPFLPSVNFSFPLDLAYLKEAFLASYTLIIIAIFNIYNKQVKIQINQTSLYLFLALIFLALQTSLLPSYITLNLLTCYIIFLSILLSITVHNSKFDLEKLIKYICFALICNGYIQCLISIFQLIGLKTYIPVNFYTMDGQIIKETMNIFPLDARNRINGGIGQINELAEILAWALIANVHTNTNKKKLFFFNAFLFTVFSCLSQSTTIILYAIFMIVYGLFLNKNHSQYSKYILLSGIFLFIGFMINWFNLLSKVQPFIYNIFSKDPNTSLAIIQARDTSTSNFQRLLMWDKGIQIFIEHPILGSGWDYYAANFLNATPRFIAHDTWKELSIPFNCHNVIIQLLATTGIIGTAIFILPFINFYKNIRKTNSTIKIVLFSIVTLTLIHSLVEFSIFESYIFIPIVILITLTNTNKYGSISYNKTLALILLTCVISFWQIICGVSNYLTLAHISPNKKYGKNQINNLLEQYQIGTNPLWEVYSDLNFIQNLPSIDANDYLLFALTKLTLEKLVLFLPSPFITNRLILVYLIENQPAKAEKLLTLSLNTYFANKELIKKDLLQISAKNQKLSAQIDRIYQNALNKISALKIDH